jgi:hypothetical protein
MYEPYHVSFLALPNNDPWFYDTLIVNKNSADTLGFGEFAELDVATKLVNLIFDVGIYACGS